MLAEKIKNRIKEIAERNKKPNITWNPTILTELPYKLQRGGHFFLEFFLPFCARTGTHTHFLKNTVVLQVLFKISFATILWTSLHLKKCRFA